MASEDRERLTELMEYSAATQRLTWEEVARRAGRSVAQLRAIRAGRAPLTLKSKLAIQRGLNWPDGTVDGILANDSESIAVVRHISTDPEPDLRDDFEAQIWALDLMTEEVRWAVIEIHREAESRRPRNGGHNQSA